MPNSNNKAQVLVGNINDYTVRFLIGDTDAGPITCVGNTFLAMIIDGSFTAGDITFMASIDGQYWATLMGSDNAIYKITSAEVSAAISAKSPDAQGIQFALDPAVFVGVQFLQIFCSNPQSTAQTVRLVMGPVLS